MFSRFLGTTSGRKWKTVLLFCVPLITGLVMGVFEGRAEALGQDSFFRSANSLWLVGGAGVLLSVISFVYGAFWMKSIDEAAQEAHKWSWYWGGSAGLTAGMVLFLLALAPATQSWTIPTLSGRTDPMAYALTGGLVLMLLLIIGYVVCWAWWWGSRR